MFPPVAICETGTSLAMLQSACWLVAVFNTSEVDFEKPAVAACKTDTSLSMLLAFLHLLQYVRQPQAW